MRKYVCPMLHICELHGNLKRELFCKQCNKIIQKNDTYKFQWSDIRQRFYLAQSPAESRRYYEKNRDKVSVYKRAFYAKKKSKLMEVPILATI